MQSLLLALTLTFSLLASPTLTHPDLQPRQSGPDPASASAAFSSAAAQLISLYIPSTLAVPFGVAVQSAASAASVTGDINSIVESALTAATPPPFLSALPSVYSSNVLSLESAISALRGAASTGVSGAARVTTGGTQVASGSVSGGVLVLTLSDMRGSTYVSSTTVVGPTSGSGSGAESTTTTVAAVLVTTTDSVGATVTSTQGSSMASSSTPPASSSTPPPPSSSAPPPSSSSKSALAAPTQVPLAAAGAGVIGLVGLFAAL